MNIVFCGDANIRDGVLTSVLSLLRFQNLPLNVTIATASIRVDGQTFGAVDEAFAAQLDALLRTERPGSSARLIDLTKPFTEQPPTANLHTRFTPCCMLRLYLDLVPELAGRVLYLDNDVLCHGPIAELETLDMRGAEIAGVLDRYGRWLFHHEPRCWDYLNSGVLLMDMDRIRATGLLKRCRALCAQKQMFMPDQSALNKLSQRKLQLPRRFNEQLRLQPNTVFQHFSTRFGPFGLVNVKPWQIERMHSELKTHAYDDVLKRYQRLRSQFINSTERNPK